MIRPTRLRCEYRDNPIDIETQRPRLSWRLEADDPSKRGQEQSAYQIVVIDHSGQVIWDSGRVASSQTDQIAYGGAALATYQQVWWKVRVWDAEGRASDWSAPATWTMALLHPQDWQGRWIRMPQVAEDRLPIFRRSLHLDKPMTRAMLYFCGLGQHELRLNGQLVGQNVLDPPWAMYNKTCLYVVHDVTQLLRAGENVLGVMLGNGMYNVTGHRYRKFKGSFGPPRAIGQLHVEHTDGTSITIGTDESWKVLPGPITFTCIYGGEDYDARLEQPGWDSPGFDDSGWMNAVISEGPGGELRAAQMPPLRVMRSYAPTKFVDVEQGVRVFDLGQNFSGWAQIRVEGQPADKVTLTTAELLGDDGQVNQKPTGSPVSYSYTLRGEGVEGWRPRFTYTGFRYVQVQTPASVKLLELEGQFIHQSAQVVGQFECSNELFNRIHRLINFAILSNLQHVMTDCPHREKLGWLEQTHLMGPSIAYNYDVARFYEKICRDMRDSQHGNGMIPTIAPQYTAFKPPWDMFNDSPEWGSAAVLCPWLIHQFYGDVRILEDNYPMMRRYIAYLASRAVEGIIEFGLGDWYDIGPGRPGFSKLTSPGLTATAIYYADLLVMEQVARLLGHMDEAAEYASRAEQTRQSFNARFFNAQTKCYDRGSQTAQAMPLALGLVPPQHRDDVLKNLIDDIRAHDDHITAGDIGFRYVIQALSQAGRSDVIGDLLSRTDPPSYGSQLERGATTLTEAWDANPRASQNHLMLGHAESWFYESLAGIRIDHWQAGPRRIVINPAIVRHVDWASASFDSAMGRISSQWRRQGQKLTLSVTIPINASATVYVPTADPASVHESGGRPDPSRGVRLLAREPAAAVFELACGSYVFESAVIPAPPADHWPE
ncbi:family 78 glycoside hydrolase catalytic domain [Fontivita pretiosa]|uniref:alpha-L-rhamnosidase n=1 Tax=Fontivita pretiosa TaxID=2989684 RepID=UPI003D180B5D